MRELREWIPIKSYSGNHFKTYQTNKKYLAKDFKNRCAYCNDKDEYAGGYNNYHVEHFAPASLFPGLMFNYDNLLYSCPYCNVHKSNKWPSLDSKINVVKNQGFLNPCEKDYYLHIKRNNDGSIRYLDSLGKYIYENLALGLQRHKYIYWCDMIDETIIKLDKYRVKHPERNDEIKDLIKDLTYVHYRFFKSISND